MMQHQLLAAVATALCVRTCAASTDSPVIGILTVPADASAGCITVSSQQQQQQQPAADGDVIGSCFDSLYPEWIGAAGGRVVPIRYDAPPSELARLFGSVNGVLFTGGETDIRLLNSTYMRAAKQLFDLVVEAHASEDYVPLWGTCMGFQTLAVLAAGRADALTSRGVPRGNPGFSASGINLPLVWSTDARNDRVAGASNKYWSRFAQGLAAATGVVGLPTDGNTPALRYLSAENITTNLHHDGVEPSSFTRIPALREFFEVVSTNVDLKGKEFVSTMEAASGAPIYGTQWHPERVRLRPRPPTI